jgi:Ca2+-dependent lipid-binding protein
MVCLYSKQSKDGAHKWIKVDQTEVMDNNLNPDYEKSFILYYYFEKHQPLKFKVMDFEKGNTYSNVGSCETTLGRILASYNQTMVMNLSLHSADEKSRG